MVKLDLSGTTALVTGETGQLGRGMVRKLAEAGADVILVYQHNAERAEAFAADIREKYGVKAYHASCDVGKLDSVMAMREKIEREFALPDIVVTAAVAQYPWKEVLDQPTEDYE
ncbi:MAG: SDR family NAD(P)-dependent oxidoreductase, partial [Clostridia bacterium]|nr:SDR family NAD(P)-dependent oxidoreductase [Clostridia bacterium]